MLKILRALTAEDRRTLIAFGEFLQGGGAGADPADARPGAALEPPPTPRHEPRPADETVIAAIKRLRRVYPMLDPGEMLHETSSLMAAHVLQGRDSGEVIDELETLFVAHYESWSSADGDAGSER